MHDDGLGDDGDLDRLERARQAVERDSATLRPQPWRRSTLPYAAPDSLPPIAPPDERSAISEVRRVVDERAGRYAVIVAPSSRKRRAG